MVESEMRPAIDEWLNRNGYYAAHECLVGGWCDVIGCMWSERIGRRRPELLEMICVELKMLKISDVIYQAHGNHYHCNLSYCAMPKRTVDRMRAKTIDKFISAKVGLLSVKDYDVKTIVFSQYRNEQPHTIFRDRLWSFKLRHKKLIEAVSPPVVIGTKGD